MRESLRWLWQRVKKDYLFAPRYAAYREMLAVARQRGYQTMSLREVYSQRAALTGQKVLALRHDIDVNIRQGVRLFFELEQAFGVTATYYFRLNTFKMTDLVKEILAAGFEVGYHFEEPASLAKQLKLSSRQQLQTVENRQRIDQMMAANLRRLNAEFAGQIGSLCSHNDFYNRRLEVENYHFVSPAIRQQFNILFEANDPDFKEWFDVCPYDVNPGEHVWHANYSPVAAMQAGVPRIYALTHPRQWHPDLLMNTRENSIRLVQELYYRAQGL